MLRPVSEDSVQLSRQHLSAQFVGTYCVVLYYANWICSDDDVFPAGFCLISTLLVRMNKNTLLNQN